MQSKFICEYQDRVHSKDPMEESVLKVKVKINYKKKKLKVKVKHPDDVIYDETHQ